MLKNCLCRTVDHSVRKKMCLWQLGNSEKIFKFPILALPCRITFPQLYYKIQFSGFNSCRLCLVSKVPQLSPPILSFLCDAINVIQTSWRQLSILSVIVHAVQVKTFQAEIGDLSFHVFSANRLSYVFSPSREKCFTLTQSPLHFFNVQRFVTMATTEQQI